MKIFKKAYVKVIVLVLIAGVIGYLADQKQKTAQTSAPAAVNTQVAAEQNPSNPEMNFNTNPPTPPNITPQAGSGSSASNVEENIPSDPLCPHKTDSYKVILKCPRVPVAIKERLKKINYYFTREFCEVQSKTTDFTLGKKFIAWTQHETNSCENKTYPHGLPEDKTYDLSDATEVVFATDFNLQSLEKYFLSNMDLKSAFNKQGYCCPKLKESNRYDALGSLESDLTKLQFRLADNENSIALQVKSFTQNSRGDVCSVPLVLKDWKKYLLTSSRFDKNQKPAKLFED